MTPPKDSSKTPKRSTDKSKDEHPKKAGATRVKPVSPEEMRRKSNAVSEGIRKSMERGFKVPLDNEPMP